MTFRLTHFVGISALALSASAASADVVHLDDVIIDGSLCVGFDCVNGESFGFDTIRMKENNIRIKADDTSTSGSFPNRDWQLTFNDSANGGQNKFSVDDITGNRTPFTIEANVRSHQLYLSDSNKVGFGTSTPVVDLHVKQGNTPTLRLEQDGSSGFQAQTWDVAGNETNFFVRDASNGSTLPFRIRPSAPSSSIYIDTDGDIGMGTASPDADLEVQTSETFTFMRMTTSGNTNNSADVTFTGGSGGTGELRYNIVDGDTQEMALNADGDLTITGTLTTAGSCSVGCDRVFTEDYEILPIDQRMAMMWENGFLPNVGPTDEAGPFNVSDKMGRMLNELEHAHIYIDQLNKRITILEEALAEKG